MKKEKIIISNIVALILASNIYADTNSTQSMGDVDVWDTQIVSSSLSLGENSIETKQATHLSDLLRDLPGVDVGGTHSINNRINIRGLQDENLDITLDGAKVQNANMFHHIGNLLINPDILKKAEIQVGTNSVVNGSLGGSVAFETKDGKDLLENGENYGARVQANYNSNDSVGASIAGYGKEDKVSFLLYHNYVDKNNWEDGNGKESMGVDGEISDSLAKISYDLSDTQTISASYDYLVDEGDYTPRPDFGNGNYAFTGNSLFDTKYTRETITLKHQLDLGDNLYVDSTVYSNENTLKRYETWTGRSPRPTLEGELIGTVKTVGFNSKAQSSFDVGSLYNTLTYGLLYDKQTSNVTWQGSKYGEDEEAISTALYIEDKVDFNNGFVLTPGIRYNHYDFDGSYGNIKDDKFTYGLASEYFFDNGFSLFANATTLFKGVEMVDVLASNRGNMTETNDLKSETGINKEVGFKYIQNDMLGADNIGFMFKYFNTDIYDYIEVDTSSSTGYQMYNAGDLNIKGFEASFAYDIGAFHSLFTYARAETQFEDTGLAAEKDPGDSISIGLDYDIYSNLILSWDSLFVLKETDVPAPLSSTQYYNEKDAYNVHDIAINYKPSSVKGLTLIAGVDNIFDEAYVSHISENRSFPTSGTTSADYEPGRSFKFTLAYKF